MHDRSDPLWQSSSAEPKMFIVYFVTINYFSVNIVNKTTDLEMLELTNAKRRETSVVSFIGCIPIKFVHSKVQQQTRGAMQIKVLLNDDEEFLGNLQTTSQNM